MDHEGQIRLVEAHAQRRRRDQRLHPVLQQGLLQVGPALARLARVGGHVQAARPKPLRHLYRIAHRQRVDDPVARRTATCAASQARRSA